MGSSPNGSFPEESPTGLPVRLGKFIIKTKYLSYTDEMNLFVINLSNLAPHTTVWRSVNLVQKW